MHGIALTLALTGWAALPVSAENPTALQSENAALRQKVMALEATVERMGASLEELKARSGGTFNEASAPGTVVGAQGPGRRPIIQPSAAYPKKKTGAPPPPGGADQEGDKKSGGLLGSGIMLLGGAVMGAAGGALAASYSYLGASSMLMGALTGGLVGLGAAYFMMKGDTMTALAMGAGSLIGGLMFPPFGGLVGGLIGLAVGKLLGGLFGGGDSKAKS